MHFLSMPYSHSDSRVKQRRVIDAAKLIWKLRLKKIDAFSPIVYMLSVVELAEEQSDDSWVNWEEYCKDAIKDSCGLIVAAMDGWDKSIGVAEEIKFAKHLNKDVALYSLDGIYLKNL